MGRLMLVCRLAARDLRRRRTETALLLLAITAATTTLTLGLALHGVASQPYEQTRAATAGPDVVAQLGAPPGAEAQMLRQAKRLAHAPGVTGHSGPYLVASTAIRARGVTHAAIAEGRDQAPAAVDQPKLTQGSWVRDGGVVIERTFAGALGVRPGDRITLDGRPFTVAGIAVTAASTPYPNLCYNGCDLPPPPNLPGASSSPGLIWLTRRDARGLVAAGTPSSYVLNLKLRDPARAAAFTSAYNNSAVSMGPMTPWQSIRAADGLLVQDEQQVLLVGTWLLGLLAVASVTVLAGGRMADQTRRVGLLKAVGGTPGLVVAVLLAEHVLLALVASVAGLTAGWLAAPLLTSPGSGLVGSAGAPSLTSSTAALVTAVAVAVAVAATVVPAIRAARTSTVAALADAARPPRRRAWLIAVSARLPLPLLLGFRLAARRPRRAILGAVSIAITVTGLVAVLTFRSSAAHHFGATAQGNPVIDRDFQVLLVLTVVLAVLAAVNAIFIAWATVLDTRHPSALARALGVTPQQAAAGLSVAQLIPALPGAVVGIPAGIELFAAANGAGAVVMTIPPAWWLLAVVLGTLLVVAVLTAIPARIGARRPVSEILQAELA